MLIKRIFNFVSVKRFGRLPRLGAVCFSFESALREMGFNGNVNPGILPKRKQYRILELISIYLALYNLYVINISSIQKVYRKSEQEFALILIIIHYCLLEKRKRGEENRQSSSSEDTEIKCLTVLDCCQALNIDLQPALYNTGKCLSCISVSI